MSSRACLPAPALLVALACAACGGASGASEAADARSATGGRDAVRETLVMVETLGRGPVRDEIVVSAKVEARTTVQVYPKLGNLQVTAVHFDEGESVRSGDVLLELFDKDLQLAAQSAGAALDEARRTRERANLTLDEDSRRVERAERVAQKAEADRARVADLGDLVNQQEVDDKRLAAENAADDLELARFAERGSRIALELAGIAVRKAEIEAEQAAADLLHTRVLSPIDGAVASRAIYPGELTSSAAPAFVLADVADLVLRLRVPQDSIGRVSRGQDVEVRPVTGGLQRFHGKVRSVNPVLDRETGTLHVLVDMDEQPGLVPGLFCEARIITAARDSALLVSKRAVLYENDQPVLFAVEGGATAKRVAFVAGAATPTQVEIVSDAEGGPVADDLQVVIVGQENLKDGAPVKVVADA